MKISISDMRFSNFRSQAIIFGCWCSLAALFFVPINKPAVNIFIAITLICTVVGKDFVGRMIASTRHPVVRGCLSWLLVLGLTSTYAPQIKTKDILIGNIALIYPLVLVSLFGFNDLWRIRSLKVVYSSMGLILLLSWLQFFGILPQRAGVETGGSLENTVFKEYTQQGIEVLTFICLSMSLLQDEKIGRLKFGLIFGALVGMASIFFATHSRTAFIVAIPIIFYWCIVFFRTQWMPAKKNLLWIAVTILSTTIIVIFSLQHQQRFSQAQVEFENSINSRNPTSIGVRLELWKKSVEIFRTAPWLGHGAGQWKSQFNQLTKDIPDYTEFRMELPHQEFLLILVEQGGIGLIIYLFLLVMLLRYIVHLHSPYKYFYLGLILIYFISGLFNSLWADFTHRHLFALLIACIPWSKNNISANTIHEK